MSTDSLFSRFSSSDLKDMLRIPELFHPFIYSIKDELDLESKSEELKKYGLYECLSLLIDYPPPLVAERLSIDDTTTYPPTPYGLSKAEFERSELRPLKVLTPDENLKRMLDAPLDEWRTYMHPLQEKIATASVGGAMKITGGAGTGKTVVAMYRTKWLVEKLFTGANDKVLFTTYTKNLAHDIGLFLKRIIKDPAALARVKVRHIDALAQELYAPFQNAREHTIYGTTGDEALRRESWGEAVSIGARELPIEPSFYRDEYEQVILPKCIFSLQHYLTVSRDGRIRALTAEERTKVFAVCDQYSRILKRKNCVESREIRLRLVRNYVQQYKKPYKAVIIDEAQDLYEEDFRLLRAICESGNNDMVFFGDGNQRIYNRLPFKMTDAGIDVKNRSRKLFLNYRTTAQISTFAKEILSITQSFDDDFDSGKDATRGTMSLVSGEEPVLRSCENDRVEAKVIQEELQRLFKAGIPASKICLISRAHRYVETIVQRLKPLLPKGIEVLEVTNDISSPKENQLRFATMHRVKGLEFEAIVICGAHELGDADRNLFYVASTRAKKYLLITYSENFLPLLR
ncbi:MAG: AAA family ATPase [Chloroherpetonaceae bacterium]|nr:AAA family ATPase [Chloroherpetonaceae bacterium]